MSMWDACFRWGFQTDFESMHFDKYIHVYTGQYIDDFRDVKLNIFGWLSRKNKYNERESSRAGPQVIGSVLSHVLDNEKSNIIDMW